MDKQLALITDPKKRKLDDKSSSSSAVVDIPKDSKKSKDDPPPEIDPPEPEAEPETENISVLFNRLVGQANPEYAQSMRDTEELGYSRSTANRLLGTTTYELIPATIRARIVDTLTVSLTWLYREHGNVSANTAPTRAAADAVLIADGCMSALYARLRTIHKSYAINPQRFNSAPLFPKEVELPLPLAIAIEQIGIFDTEDVVTKARIVPTFPENIQNEGRSAATWNLSQYLSVQAFLKNLNIPFKKVNVMNKTGTPWWTFKAIYNHGVYDLQCIFPPQMYTALAVTLRILFLARDDHNAAIQLYTALADEIEHPLRARQIHPRERRNAFFALCNFPNSYWSTATPR